MKRKNVPAIRWEVSPKSDSYSHKDIHKIEDGINTHKHTEKKYYEQKFSAFEDDHCICEITLNVNAIEKLKEKDATEIDEQKSKNFYSKKMGCITVLKESSIYAELCKVVDTKSNNIINTMLDRPTNVNEAVATIWFNQHEDIINTLYKIQSLTGEFPKEMKQALENIVKKILSIQPTLSQSNEDFDKEKSLWKNSGLWASSSLEKRQKTNDEGDKEEATNEYKSSPRC